MMFGVVGLVGIGCNINRLLLMILMVFRLVFKLNGCLLMGVKFSCMVVLELVWLLLLFCVEGIIKYCIVGRILCSGNFVGRVILVNLLFVRMVMWMICMMVLDISGIVFGILCLFFGF